MCELFKHTNFKDIVAIWICVSFIVILLMGSMLLLKSDDRDMVKSEFIRYTRLETLLSEGQRIGFSGLVIVNKPLSENDIQKLVDTRPVCFVAENSDTMELIAKKFFGNNSNRFKLIKYSTDLTADIVDGFTYLIVHRDIADNLQATDTKLIRDKYYISIWYNLKSPINFFYMGTIGMNYETAKRVTLAETTRISEGIKRTANGQIEKNDVIYKTVMAGTKNHFIIHSQKVN